MEQYDYQDDLHKSQDDVKQIGEEGVEFARKHGEKAYNKLKSLKQQLKPPTTEGASAGSSAGGASAGATGTAEGASAGGATTGATEGASAGAVAGGSGGTATGTATGITAGPIMIGIAIFLVLLLIIQLFAQPRVLLGTENHEVAFTNMKAAMTPAYEKTVSEIKTAVLQYVNEEYECEASESDITDGNQSFSVKTDGCEINIKYGPEMDVFVKPAAAYMGAVNSQLTWYSPKQRKEGIASQEEDLYYDFTSYEHYRYEENDFADNKKKYFERIREKGDGTLELDSEKFKEIVEHFFNNSTTFIFTQGMLSKETLLYEDIEIIEETEENCYIMLDTNEQIQVSCDDEQYPAKYKISETKKLAKGNIEITISLEISAYRIDEIYNSINSIVGTNEDVGNHISVSNVVMKEIDQKYHSLCKYWDIEPKYINVFSNFVENPEIYNSIIQYADYSGSNTISHTFVGSPETFRVGRSAFDNGLLVPYYESLPIYHNGHCLYTLPDGTVLVLLWCTSYVQLRVYEMYGFDPGVWDGYRMYERVIQKSGGKFREASPGEIPKPGSVFSFPQNYHSAGYGTTAARCGHCGMVLECDGETIVISDTSKGDVRMSYADFLYYGSSDSEPVKFAIPVN